MGKGEACRDRLAAAEDGGASFCAADDDDGAGAAAKRAQNLSPSTAPIYRVGSCLLGVCGSRPSL